MPMPLADLFQPDINFVPARAVYPTASGGSLSSAGGAMTESTNTVVPTPDGSAPTTVTAGPPLVTSGKSVVWWLGALLLLMVMVWAARKAGGEEDFRNIRPTVYNFLTITLTSIVGIVGAKVIAAKYRIPGASDIIMAV